MRTFRGSAAIDNYQRAAALYRETVLAAFAQIADALRALDDDAAAGQMRLIALALSRALREIDGRRTRERCCYRCFYVLP
jgi:outer membrane protein TolC